MSITCSDLTKNNTVTIGFGGDVMLGRLVNEEISRRDFRYPWGSLRQKLLENDLNIVNLETTLTLSDKKVEKVFNFKADPDKVKTLLEGKIGLVNIANNHILDFSQEGLIETIATLDKASILHVGAGANLALAKKPAVITMKGINIGVLGYTDNEPGWLAKKDQAGTNYINVPDIDQVKRDIASVRKDVHVLIMTIHWGPNMREQPTEDFIAFAHSLIDAGIDIIHGHSAHVTQGVEIYKNKIILYDTGDLVDDYMVGPDLRNDHTFLFQVTIKNGTLSSLQLVPAQISSMQVNIAKNPDRDQMMTRMKQLSRRFGTVFKEQNGTLVLDL